jgi:ribosomal protein S18 acetylase RimI-like enzyme
MSIKIIQADSSHAATIATIGKLSFRDAFADLFNNKKELQEYLDYTYAIPKIKKSIEKEGNAFFLAFIDEVPVGFTKLKKNSLEPQIRSIAQMELQKIYVLSYYHGSGVALSLMSAVIEHAHEIQPDYLWLHVHLSNEKAIRFYKKNGFTISGKHSFTIGTQNFDFHMMCLPVAVLQPCYEL